MGHITAIGELDTANRAVCFDDGDILKEPPIPGVKQMIVTLSCPDPKDVCIFRSFSDVKQKMGMEGVKLACCDCSKYPNQSFMFVDKHVFHYILFTQQF